MPFTPDEQRAYRQRLREKGICVRCHKSETYGSRATCVGCGDDINTRRRERRRRYRAEGKCTECGSGELLSSAMCEKHHLRWLQTGRDKWRRRVENGQCPVCGIDLPDRDYNICGRCNVKHRMYNGRPVYR